MSYKTEKSGRSASRLGLLALTPIMAAMLAGSLTAEAAGPFAATAKYDRKAGKVVVAGKTTAKIPAIARISVYDASNQQILYTSNTDNKRNFNFKLFSATNTPCAVRVEITNPSDNAVSKSIVQVSGAPKTCTTTAVVPACAIATPSQDAEIFVNASQEFKPANIKFKRGVTPTYNWSINDGSADVTTSSTNHVFKSTGRFKATLTVTANGNKCQDDVFVSVIPPSGSNPFGKVGEQLPAPSLAGAMPAGGQNDKDAIVVMPYEETGMQGGSQIHLPYNALLNYNALNAQVIQKLAHKPAILPNSSVDLAYSAASNPKDPIAANSINSTSQNLFSGLKTGTNYDSDSSTTTITSATSNGVTTKSQSVTKNVFIGGQDYREAVIAKSEQWDRIHQPYAAAKSVNETGKAFADDQNRFTPPKPYAKPDQGLRGQIDSAVGMRQMPGISDPFKANVPQAFDFRADQNAFVAQAIPASNIDDQGRTNPYPLMRVEAKDKSGKVVAKTDAVYTTASETRCRECHTKGKMGSDNTVWRTPVTEEELKNPNDASKPGPATGAGSFAPGADPAKAWPPAIHNRFDDKIADNANFTNLGVTKDAAQPLSATNIPVDQNGLRKDRVEESRWAKFDLATGKPLGDVKTGKPAELFSSTKPAGAGLEWKLQIRVKYRDPSAPDNVTELANKAAGDSWIDQEKAALFNTLVAHDYMVYYGPTPAANKTWPASYSTQVADSYADDLGKSRAQPMYFCSGHHQSHLKADFGIVAQPTQTNRSDYSRAFHAFHGKFQVYKKAVSASESEDGLAHETGELIRDSRGHPVMFGGRGWDSQRNDNNGVPLTLNSNGAVVKTTQNYDTLKNDWRPDLFPALWDKKPDIAAPMLQFGDKIANDDNCTKCHTGKTEKSYRDIHHTVGLKCESCHGDMLAVGNAYSAPMYDFNLTGGGTYTGSAVKFRRPWMDEPNCGSCHIGDANKLTTDALFYSPGVLKQAWMKNYDAEGVTVNDTATTESYKKVSELFSSTANAGSGAGATTHPINARFAVMPVVEIRKEFPAASTTIDGVATTVYKDKEISTVLYRKSQDVHGSKAGSPLACAACHGGSHAIWPNQDPNANDNQTAKQLQGYDGNIAECSVCHVEDDFKEGFVATDGGKSNLGVAQGVRDNTGSYAIDPTGKDKDGAVTGKAGRAYLAGPHGMHPINDKFWYQQADGAAKNAKATKFNGGWHNDMSGMAGPDGEDQCAACHGANHKGTRLSKAFTYRKFIKAKSGKDVVVSKGQVIGCDLCHTLAKSFSKSPTKNPKNPGWQPAANHMPPMPAAITPSVGGGTSSGH